MKYFCEKCKYQCERKSSWEQHILTMKHLNNYNIGESNNKLFCCTKCNKSYKSKSGLWKHNKICVSKKDLIKESDKNSILDSNINNNTNAFSAKIMNDMMTQIKEQNKIISDMLPKIGSNNNNQFNINVFLNEKCSDAINMSEFIESIQIQLEDLNYTKNNGLLQSISSIFVNGLKQLDTYKRPIHCTDIKRETLYIKDNNEWDKEDGRIKIHSAIKDIAAKQRKAIYQWEQDNPNWNSSDKGKDDYIKLVKSIMSDISDEESKIVKNIAKETIIDK